MIATFGVVAAVGVLSDSGAALYILNSTNLSSKDFKKCLALQLSISLSASLIGTAYSFLALEWRDSFSVIALILSLFISQSADSLVRVARAVQLLRGSDLKYASGDALLAITKIAAAGAVAATSSLAFLALLPVASSAIAAYFISKSLRGLESSEPHASIVDVLKFGLSGVFSGMYSQAPYLIAVAIIAPESVAELAIIIRTMQPLEIAPAVASQQLMPRVTKRRLAPIPIWISFVAVGAGAGGAVVLARPIIERVFDTSLESQVAIYTLAIALAVKYGNYALTAFALALGGVTKKIYASAIAGLVAVLLSVALLPGVGAQGAATAMLLSEVVLAGMLLLLIDRLRNPEVTV
jgi:hypothetical protein